MGMAVGAQDVSSMLNKSQMIGHTQQLRTEQTVKELDKQKEIEQARTDSSESATSSGSKSVNSNSGTARTASRRRLGTEQPLRQLGQGRVEWDEQEQKSGQDWFPPSLQPHSKGAGSASQWNIPYWLMQSEQPHSDAPMAQHKRLLNGLRTMVKTEIEQYTKQNEPMYARKTLRDIYSVLSDEAQGARSASPHGFSTMSGDPAGYNQANARKARGMFDIFNSARPSPGDGFRMVA